VKIHNLDQAVSLEFALHSGEFLSSTSATSTLQTPIQKSEIRFSIFRSPISKEGIKQPVGILKYCYKHQISVQIFEKSNIYCQNSSEPDC
jgi:hypothetical protein